MTNYIAIELNLQLSLQQMRKKGLIFLPSRLVHKDASVIFENSTQPATKIASKYGLYEIIVIPLNVLILITQVANFFYMFGGIGYLFSIELYRVELSIMICKKLK